MNQSETFIFIGEQLQECLRLNHLTEALDICEQLEIIVRLYHFWIPIEALLFYIVF